MTNWNAAKASESFLSEGSVASGDIQREHRFSMLRVQGARATVGDWGKHYWPRTSPERVCWTELLMQIYFLWSLFLDLPHLLRVHWVTEVKFQNAPFKSMFHYVFIKNVKTYYFLFTPENSYTRRIITGPCFPLPGCFLYSETHRNSSSLFMFPSSWGFITTEQSMVWNVICSHPKELWTIHNFRFHHFLNKIIADL